jgi:hypothetical protein
VAQGPVCIVEFPDLAQRLAYRLMKRFWQTFDHVAGLMVRRTTLLKASAPSTMNSRQTSGIEPALDEMVAQRLHYGGVQLGCPPPLRNALRRYNSFQTLGTWVGPDWSLSSLVPWEPKLPAATSRCCQKARLTDISSWSMANTTA